MSELWEFAQRGPGALILIALGLCVLAAVVLAVVLGLAALAGAFRDGWKSSGDGTLMDEFRRGWNGDKGNDDQPTKRSES